MGFQPTCIQIHSAHLRGFTKRECNSFRKMQSKGNEISAFKGSNFYPFPPYLAKPLSYLFPNAAVGIFFKIDKIDEYKVSFSEATSNLEGKELKEFNYFNF